MKYSKLSDLKQSFALNFLLFLLGCTNNQSSNLDKDYKQVIINYSVSKILPHDTSLFTEGLVMYNGILYESTGSPEQLKFSKSNIGFHEMSTGKFITKIEIDKSKYFGEGIVFLNDKLYQLTYLNQIGFIYDSKNFNLLDSFSFKSIEGWGLTTDSQSIIMSDGTSELSFFDPKDLTSPTKKLMVTDEGMPLIRINELEFINGYIYANIWLTNFIVKINPMNGCVVGKLDLGSLTNEILSRKPNADVLNGIAYDSKNDKVYVTGKLWPSIYCIEFKK